MGRCAGGYASIHTSGCNRCYCVPDAPPLRGAGRVGGRVAGCSACHSWGRLLHCVHATTEDPHAALWRRALSSLAHSCLGIATLNRKIAKYGKSLSHLETCSPGVGRMHAVQKPPLGVCIRCHQTRCTATKYRTKAEETNKRQAKNPQSTYSPPCPVRCPSTPTTHLQSRHQKQCGHVQPIRTR